MVTEQMEDQGQGVWFHARWNIMHLYPHSLCRMLLILLLAEAIMLPFASLWHGCVGFIGSGYAQGVPPADHLKRSVRVIWDQAHPILVDKNAELVVHRILHLLLRAPGRRPSCACRRPTGTYLQAAYHVSAVERHGPTPTGLPSEA